MTGATVVMMGATVVLIGMAVTLIGRQRRTKHRRAPRATACRPKRQHGRNVVRPVELRR
jgi:hypothetical protein